ncbi:diacylglyceryl transferase [Galbibacter sp. EGI 63066]|uniref:DUF6787 family protein n=1 Tax=Galbibacter sp. EGI 63066 TaxID=2993559 RepID=UPI0022496433|nr:DUF6787 family protein [Galbibacter sp. EGI 63066]MCX2678690.1 diacylglyceryl transferase [Galbibacter sp. EGI 63066]
MKKLKQRWGVRSNAQLLTIIAVFAVTGSTAVKLAGPVLDLLGVQEHPALLYWPVRILVIFPLYQILLVCFGWLFGQFRFFRDFEKRMLKRIGLGFLFVKR